MSPYARRRMESRWEQCARTLVTSQSRGRQIPCRRKRESTPYRVAVLEMHRRRVWEGAMEDEPRDTCFGAGSVAGAVIGTFLTTILLLVVAALLYRQWRRHKGEFQRVFPRISRSRLPAAGGRNARWQIDVVLHSRSPRSLERALVCRVQVIAMTVRSLTRFFQQ